MPSSASWARDADRAAVGWHVPWAIGGPRLASDGSVYQHPGEWPDFPVSSIRLWDTRTAWLNLQPRPDRFDFANLDAHLDRAQQAGVRHVTLVLAGTPRWAAMTESATDAPWLGPGSASPPVHMHVWEKYVAEVATRYRGRIEAYEIWNEPNATMFWTGNFAQLGEMVTTAADIIRRADSGATIVAPGPLITHLSDVDDAAGVWSTIADSSIDALSFHFYPRTPGDIADLPLIVRKLRAVAREQGMGHLPLWMTEVNPGPRASASHAASIVYLANRVRLPRLYWYAWMAEGPPNLWRFPSSGDARPGHVLE